jgi:hypothetical protein
MNKKVLGFLGLSLLLVVGAAVSFVAHKVLVAQAAGCSVLHSFGPATISAGGNSTQFYSFSSWETDKYDYTWDCSNGRSGVISAQQNVKTVTSGDFFVVGQTTSCTMRAVPKEGSGVTGCSATASLTVNQVSAPSTYSCGGSVPSGATMCSGTITSGLAVPKNWTEVQSCTSGNSFCEFTKQSAPVGSGINCSVSPSSQSASQSGSAMYSVRNNSTEGVWAGIFPEGSNVSVDVAGGYADPHPRGDRGKIYLNSGQSASFTVHAYVKDRDVTYPANPGSYEGSITCAKSDPYEVLPVGTFQRVGFNFTVLDAGQTCGLSTISTPNYYTTILQGESKDFTFRYSGSAGGKAFFNVNQNIEGVTFSVSPSGPTLKEGDIVRITASASYGAPIKSYYPAGQLAPRPISYGCEINGKKINYDGYDFAVIAAGSTVFTGYEPDAYMKINVSPNLDGLKVKKGDKFTFNVVLENPGSYSGKAGLKLYDVPAGITADLKMDSDYMPSRGSIKGVLNLNVTGRVPSGANRLMLMIDTGGLLDGTSTYRRCRAGVDYLCMMKALHNDSKSFNISGADANFGNSEIPATVNAVEPSILKRVKVMPGGVQQENMGFLLMNVQYGTTPFISADVRTSDSSLCYPHDSGNCPGGGKAEKWYVSQIDLKDPLNPGFAQERLWVMEDGDDIAGDDGGHHEPTAVGMSRDGTIAMGSHHQGLIQMSSSQNPDFRKRLVGVFESAAFFLVDSPSDTFRVNSTGYNGYFTKQSGYTIQTVTRLGREYEEYVAGPLPKNIPNIIDKQSPVAPLRAIDGESSDGIVVLGNGGKNANYNVGSVQTLSDISIYSMDRSSPLGTALMSGFSKYYGYASVPFGFETPNGKYAFAVTRDKDAASFNVGKRIIYLYKLDAATKKLVPIIEEARISEGGQVKDVTMIHVSGKDFLMVFVNRAEPDKSLVSRVLIYSLDELKAGKVRDIASGSISYMKNIRNAESLIQGDVTYVYTVDEQGGFLIWKFDKQSLSGTGIAAPVIGGGSGGSTGTGSGGGTTQPPTYDCNFDLSFVPTSLSVRQGTYFANYTIKANSTSVNPFCTIMVTPPTKTNITPFLNSLVVSPGGQASMLLNVSKAAKGSYDLIVKAATKGVAAKTYTIKLTIE